MPDKILPTNPVPEANGAAGKSSRLRRNGHPAAGEENVKTFLLKRGSLPRRRALEKLLTVTLKPRPQEPTDEERRAEGERQRALPRLRREQKRMEGKAAALRKQLAEYPRWLKPENRTRLTWRIVLYLTGLVAVLVLCSLNTARYAVNLTDSWIQAVFFTIVIPMLAIGLEHHATHLCRDREALDRTLARLFAVSGLTFIGAFAWAFAYEPDLRGGGALKALSGQDYRLMLVAQCLVEITTSVGFFYWIRRDLERQRQPEVSPEWVQLDAALRPVQAELGELSARIEALAGESALFRHRLAELKAYDLGLTRLIGL